MMLASSITVGAAAMSQRSVVRRHIIPKLIDLDLCSYDVRMDLLDLWSVREFVELIESDNKIGTWSLIDWLVANHVKCLFQIALMAGQATTIFTGLRGCFCVSTMLAIGVLLMTSVALFSSFTLLGNTIMADVENHAPEP